MGLGGFGGPARRAPPTLLEGAGQAPPLTGCLRPIHLYSDSTKKQVLLVIARTCRARGAMSVDTVASVSTPGVEVS